MAVATLELGTFDLGEAPVWDERSATLSFVDINAGHLHVWNPDTGDRWRLDAGQALGAAVPRERGGFVAALREGVALLDGDGLTWLAPGIVPDTHRFNDAKCDPQGRLWAGTLAMELGSQPGALYRIDADGEAAVMLEDVGLANGMGWSPDGATFYLIDSAAAIMWAFDFDGADGSLSKQRVHIDFDPDEGMPDGMAVDVEGAMWVARYGTHALERYTASGDWIERIQVPAKQPTCPGFGGERLDVLYVTSAIERLADPSPVDGAVFRVDVPVAGLSAYRFRG